MSILIKDADISPGHIQCITVFPEGFAVVEEYEMLLPIKTTKCEVAAVPTPHGRLIDADAIFEQWYQLNFDRKISDGTLAYWNVLLGKARTVIEAEEGEG